LPKLSGEIDIQESTTSNPEEYYGQDPYEFMTKLYSVQPSRTYPCVVFEIPQTGWLVNCQEYISDEQDLKGKDGLVLSNLVQFEKI
jgi:hypothetical protein